MCAFSTHGDQSPLDQHLQTHIKGTLVSDIIFGRDGTMTITEITERFTDNACPSLSGKPKLFFFQVSPKIRVLQGLPISDRPMK